MPDELEGRAMIKKHGTEVLCDIKDAIDLVGQLERASEIYGATGMSEKLEGVRCVLAVARAYVAASLRLTRKANPARRGGR